MQTLLRNWLELCWNVALIFMLTLLILTPLWNPAFKIACCMAVVWPVCFMYLILGDKSVANDDFSAQ